MNLKYGETPYETEHQVCRGDTEEDMLKERGQRLSKYQYKRSDVYLFMAHFFLVAVHTGRNL